MSVYKKKDRSNERFGLVLCTVRPFHGNPRIGTLLPPSVYPQGTRDMTLSAARCKSASHAWSAYSSGSIAGMPRCSTDVEKTICVRVRPKRWSWLMNWSSSCVVRKHTLMSME